ncbi:MAG TPA: YrzE family protein, partial [Acidimicrobiales bacterium]|nr:YrzE family protein [Acidimicrobiales bacterium]
MGRFSIVSVLAGALCAFAAFEALVAIAAAVAVAIHGGTNFGTASNGAFKTLVGIVVAVALFVAFMLGGYVAGRMSRRRGASHGLIAGILGVVLGAVVVAAVRAGGADNGLARVAAHIGVAATWHDWRTFSLLGVIVAGAAMVVGGLTGGIEGERWHGKLLARAVDPSFGPEAEERAAARKRLREAEMARLAAADHVSRLTAAEKATDTPREPVPAATETDPNRQPATAILNRATRRSSASSVDPAARSAETAVNQPVSDTARADTVDAQTA